MSAAQQSKRLKSSTAVYTCFNPLCTFQTFNSRGFWNHVAHTGHTYDNQLNERLLTQLRNTKPVLYNLFIENNCLLRFISMLSSLQILDINDSDDFSIAVNNFLSSNNINYYVDNIDDNSNSDISVLSTPIDENCNNEPVDITTNKAESFFAYTVNDNVEIELLTILKDMNAPLYAFQKIMEWAQRSVEQGYTFNPHNKTYRGQITKLESKIPRMFPRPTIQSIKLHPDNFQAYVPLFDFVSTLTALLEDPELNQIQNLDVNFDIEQRFFKYQSPNNLLSSVNSGLWYDTAYNNLITDPNNEFLVPIIFAFDECLLSSESNLSVLALYFTTTLFNYHTRTNHDAWRILGYVPNDRNYYSKQQLHMFTSNEKSLRLHQLLETVLSSFTSAQNDETLNHFSLRLGQYRKTVNLKVPLFFIIGDLQGGDKVSGRILNYNTTAKRISRCCDATPDCFLAPNKHQCTRLHMENISNLLKEATEINLEAINDLYQQPHWNAFFNVEFGHPFGIFTAACPVEGLHALENGLMKDALTEIFVTILSSQQVKELDTIVQGWCHLPKQQYVKGSNNDFPRLYFSDGVSTITDTTASHKVGMLFATTIAFLTFPGHVLLHKAAKMTRHQNTDRNLTVDTIYVLELLMCFWQWLKKPAYWQRNDNEAYNMAQTSITNFMTELQTYLPRVLGQGWDTCKFHEMVHIAYNIVLFGAHRNVHSGPAEHNHIALAKQPAETTSKNRKTLEADIANRFVDNQIISYFYKKIHYAKDNNSTQQFCAEQQQTTNVTLDVDNNNHLNTVITSCDQAMKIPLKFTITDQGLKLSTSNSSCQQQLTQILNEDIYHELSQVALALLHNTPVNSSVKFTILSHIKRDDLIFHANWNTEKQLKWNDWVMIAWDTLDATTEQVDVDEQLYVPAQIQLLYKIDHLNVYNAIVHSAKYDHEKHSVLSIRWELEYNDNLSKPMKYGIPWTKQNLHMIQNTSKPILRTVTANAIQEHCLVLPFHPQSSTVLQIVHSTQWPDLFSTV